MGQLIAKTSMFEVPYCGRGERAALGASTGAYHIVGRIGRCGSSEPTPGDPWTHPTLWLDIRESCREKEDQHEVWRFGRQ
jgi:uncharacterized Zn-finger protein